jgi:Fe-S-cluster containining protein
MMHSLPVITNLSEARFECTFGRGCEGICCRNGRPGLYPEELETLTAHLDRFLELMRPTARAVALAEGVVSGRRRHGLPLLRVVEGWCIFFNAGCVLHRLGLAEGDAYRYKPAACALFPLAKNDRDEWYVRQAGYEDEQWDLFCLRPSPSTPPATETLTAEIALAARYDAEQATSD